MCYFSRQKKMRFQRLPLYYRNQVNRVQETPVTLKFPQIPGAVPEP